MVASAYQLWLKKREFKAPHPPPTAATTSTATIHLATPKESLLGASNSFQDSCEAPKTHSSKFHAVSGAETTQVTVKSVSRPSAAKKRVRSWLSSEEEAADVEQGPRDAKVAEVGYVAESKVAGLKGSRTGKELMNATAIKLTSAAKVVRQSSTKRDVERAVWTERVDREPNVGARVDADANAGKRVKSSSVLLKQSDDTHSEEVKKQRRLVIGSVCGGVVGGKSLRQLQNLRPQKEFVERKRGLDETTTGDTTLKRLRFDGDRDESGPSGLPPKSPLKLRKMRTAMLDESQYWMAVDRFSHLT
ncbi:hypothetical protein V7S43_008685 [Phytophthora oleae]|uniref:Uncharacterized protein n=1 Tax=Phytophthora oleae TaxID=2107226 RepID=A0ABD3FHN4_9STRA